MLLCSLQLLPPWLHVHVSCAKDSKDSHVGLCNPDGQTAYAWGNDLELRKVHSKCWPVPSQSLENSAAWDSRLWVFFGGGSSHVSSRSQRKQLHKVWVWRKAEEQFRGENQEQKTAQRESFRDGFPANIRASFGRTSQIKNFGQAVKTIEKHALGCGRP